MLGAPAPRVSSGECPSNLTSDGFNGCSEGKHTRDSAISVEHPWVSGIFSTRVQSWTTHIQGLKSTYTPSVQVVCFLPLVWTGNKSSHCHCEKNDSLALFSRCWYPCAVIPSTCDRRVLRWPAFHDQPTSAFRRRRVLLLPDYDYQLGFRMDSSTMLEGTHDGSL